MTAGKTAEKIRELKQISRKFSNRSSENEKYRKEPMRHIKYNERFNVCVIGVPEGKNKREPLVEEILADNFPN